jgi:SnoaL-like domain
MENNTLKNTWETYTQSWSETEPSKRIQLFEQALSPDCVYTDPLMQTTGYEQLSGYMSELQKNIPGVSFVTTDFKSHHDRSLTHWDMVDGEGNCLAQGGSYGLYGSDGRLAQMSGFFDPSAG